MELIAIRLDQPPVKIHFIAIFCIAQVESLENCLALSGLYFQIKMAKTLVGSTHLMDSSIQSPKKFSENRLHSLALKVWIGMTLESKVWILK